MAIPFAAAKAGLDLFQMGTQAFAQRQALGSQARTQRFGAEATFAEAEDVALSTQFDVSRIRKQGVRDLETISAQLAAAGVEDLDDTTFEIFDDAITELELSALMAQRAGEFEESQLRLSAESQAEQARDTKAASRRTFLGIKI